MTRPHRPTPSPRILAIDPGTTESAWVILDGTAIRAFGKEPNVDVESLVYATHVDELAIEMIASYGMPVGAEVFETCTWIGRFEGAWDRNAAAYNLPRRVFRKDVKMHLCQSSRANDATIRQALIDRYGPGKERAVGRKATPGPLYGMKRDTWAALAVGLTALETPRAEAVAS